MIKHIPGQGWIDLKKITYITELAGLSFQIRFIGDGFIYINGYDHTLTESQIRALHDNLVVALIADNP